MVYHAIAGFTNVNLNAQFPSKLVVPFMYTNRLLLDATLYIGAYFDGI